MKVFTLRREQQLPISVKEAWDFFSTPRNLARITPADMDFTIVSELPDAIYSGMQIAYKVRPLLGIQTGWITEIKDVQAPFVFTDTQLKGPYSLWHHKHTLKRCKAVC
jgi:ligand-binding SRPBCC domain-containing protein